MYIFPQICCHLCHVLAAGHCPVQRLPKTMWLPPKLAGFVPYFGPQFHLIILFCFFRKYTPKVDHLGMIVVSFFYFCIYLTKFWKKAGKRLKKSYLIGICGGSASGKTTVAKKIIEKLEMPWVCCLFFSIPIHFFKGDCPFDGFLL
jgi:hypothetical protein